MCSNYHFTYTNSHISDQIKKKVEEMNISYKTGDLFPSDTALCLIPKGDKIDVSSKNFGFHLQSLLINARLESIHEKRTFSSILHNRCALPCNYFYEWDKNKQKYKVEDRGELSYLGALYNEKNEFVILTKESSYDFYPIHTRSPLLMNKEEMLNFLFTGNTNFKDKEFIFEPIVTVK